MAWTITHIDTAIDQLHTALAKGEQSVTVIFADHGAAGDIRRRRVGSVPRVVAAAARFVLPSFVAMTALTVVYLQSGPLSGVRAVFCWLGALVVAIVLNAAISLGQSKSV